MKLVIFIYFLLLPCQEQYVLKNVGNKKIGYLSICDNVIYYKYNTNIDYFYIKDRIEYKSEIYYFIYNNQYTGVIIIKNYTIIIEYHGKMYNYQKTFYK